MGRDYVQRRRPIPLSSHSRRPSLTNSHGHSYPLLRRAATARMLQLWLMHLLPAPAGAVWAEKGRVLITTNLLKVGCEYLSWALKDCALPNSVPDQKENPCVLIRLKPLFAGL